MPSTLDRISLPEHLDEAVIALDLRRKLLARSYELPSGRERPGRFWKIDLESIDLAALAAGPPATAEIDFTPRPGLIVCDLSTAAREHRALFEQAFGRAVDPMNGKFAAIAAALCNTGVFVYVPADAHIEEPVRIRYDAPAQGALFPYTLVYAGRGSHVTIVEELSGASGATIAGIAEVVTAENSTVTYAIAQSMPKDARVFFTRVAAPGKDATMTWCAAELGAALTVGSMDVAIENAGVQAAIAGFFFPTGDQHVDIISTVRHDVGESRSETLIRSAAGGAGQARYLGNIRIAPHAQGTNASLRDDALLLSRRAHIDSVPALEIGANDVKAFHGATIGALDDSMIFYMESRGIDRAQAEKMVALGFFEPVLDRFPTAALRDGLRQALEQKLA